MKTITTNNLKKSHKIINYRKASKIIKSFKSVNKLTIYTSGVFDLIHTGHIRYLQAAKSAGNILSVGLESDKTIRNIRGKGRPFNNIKERLEVLSALQYIDFVFELSQVLASYKESTKIFEERYRYLKPDIVAIPKTHIGTTSHVQQIKKAGCKVLVIDTPALYHKSSTKTFNLMKKII